MTYIHYANCSLNEALVLPVSMFTIYGQSEAHELANKLQAKKDEEQQAIVKSIGAVVKTVASYSDGIIKVISKRRIF